MLKLRRSEQLRRASVSVARRYLGQQDQKPQSVWADEYTEQPQYPRIHDPSFRARKEREAENWHEQIRNARTVEEKLIKINMPRYYGYKVVQLGDERVPYNSLPATQHYTRTAFEEIGELKVEGEEKEKQLEALVQAAKGDVLDSLEFAQDFYSHQDRGTDPIAQERRFAQLIVEQVHRAVLNSLAADCKHLHDVEVDYNPRHEAFWFVGGIDPPKNIVKSKEGREWQKDIAKDPINRMMQYVATPYLAVRHRHQLAPWKSVSAAEAAHLAKELPRYKLDPRTMGYLVTHRHGTNIPGFWPSANAAGFGSISYQSRAHMQRRPASYGAEDFGEALHAQAIQSSFAWLLAQAAYNGFSTFDELTYPLCTQTIITDGRAWSFYEYQLNTLLLHGRHVDENPRLNFCRGTSELQLYREFDEAGRCVGFDERVLRYLVQFYANAPENQLHSSELQPYLSTELKRIADYEDPEQREFLERVFKHMSSNRPRHLPLPEIYLWEKIYKIDNKTRQLEAKRRYFELGINPWKRTMDQHQKEYIPRTVRPEGPKSRKKFKKMYYP